MLSDAAKRMHNMSKGSMISNGGYEHIVGKAIALKDVTDVTLNTTTRCLKNPQFAKEKVDIENRKEIYRIH
jgi:hypothetical protein